MGRDTHTPAPSVLAMPALRSLCAWVSLLCAMPIHAFLPDVSALRSSPELHRTSDCRHHLAMTSGVAYVQKAAADLATVSILWSIFAAHPASAIGPVKIALSNPTYASVTCPPKTQIPGQKAGFGLKPVCVRVTAQAENPSKKDIKEPAIFGRVMDEDGTSVVANNPDGASDAGQFAIIQGVVPPGKSQVEFQFVAAIGPAEDFEKKALTFPSLKAISYPGGGRYGAITECEMNPLADECELGDDSAAYRRASR